ncbi:MAG: alpha/beta hydrolase [Myxococcales bacterium]|nr:alpha/beta hydrolase [Myxococcales bacterium]
MGPARGRRVTANGLQHHLTEWDGGGDLTVLLLHGFLDLGPSWTFVVEALPADLDWHVVALDFRGHGQSDRVGPGGYYHFPDYVRDVAAIARQIRRSRLVVVGHSMGAQVASLWLGARPGDAQGLLLLEALGPPPLAPADYPDRFARWLDETVPFEPARFERPMRDQAHAADRLRRMHRGLDEADALRLAGWAAAPGDDGAWRWRYDPLHRTRSPLPLLPEAGQAFWARLDLPVWWIGGADSPWVGPALHARLAHIPNLVRQTLPNTGHMLHTEAPRAVADLCVQFVEAL